MPNGTHLNSFFPLWNNLKAVEKHFNISRWYSLQNWSRLHFSVTRLTFDDYFFMHLFNRQLNIFQKQEYLGEDIWKKIVSKYFSSEWLVTSEDKLFIYDILRQHGYNAPNIYGLFHRYRHLNYAPTLKNKEELKNFLQDDLTYPCFTKPVYYYGSYDSFYLTGYDKKEDILFDHQLKPIPFDQFYNKIESHYLHNGYLFQNAFQPDIRFSEISDNRLCSMRIIVILTEQGPECLGALLKIPTNNNHADNFWRLGNIIAIIDQDTGKITQALQKTTFSFPLPVIEHAITKKIFTEFIIPDWKKLKPQILRLASLFPMLFWQSWDIAFSDQGWVPLEPNYSGDIHFAQWLYGKGLKSRVESFLNIKIDEKIWT